MTVRGEIILQNLRTKTKYEIKGNHQHPSIVAHLTVDGLVKEFPGWIDLTDPASIKMVEKMLQKDIEKRKMGMPLLRSFSSTKSIPFVLQIMFEVKHAGLTVENSNRNIRI